MKISNKPNLKLNYLINGILIQSFLQIILITLSHDGIFPELEFSNRFLGVALIVNLIVFLLVLLNIQRLRMAATQETIIEQQKNSLKNLGKLVGTIQQQKHDFINHLQVISGLVQLHNYDELKRYVYDITNEIKPQFQFIALSRLELKSLLFVKAGIAKEKNITFDITVKDDFEDFPLCQIASVNLLANLINNAFTASLESSNPKVSVFMGFEDGDYVVRVHNNGSYIPDHLGDSVFAKGYTTKSAEGGLGLPIVKALIDKIGGSLSYVSCPESGTEFTAKVPATANTTEKIILNTK